MAGIKPDEISGIIKQQLAGVTSATELEEYGTVLQVGDGIARVYGLENAQAGELVSFENGTEAIVLNLEEDNVGVVLMGTSIGIQEGSRVSRTGRIASIQVGEGMVGRVVNALGVPIDGKGDITGTTYEMPLERKAPGVIYRQPVTEPLQTGIKAIDAMIPIGRGQRELIIGDRQTGKSAIAIDTILNQKEFYERGEPVYCIYVACGQKASTVAQIAKTLEEEFFRDTGRPALIIYDDLSKQAVAYREVSLLLRRPPGREAYLPIIETQAGDVSAYIPTNVISITDGQIFLTSTLFNNGIRPAIDVGISVSRVGGSAQIKPMKKVSGTLKLDQASYRELEAFAKFGSDLDASTQNILEKGKRNVEMLKQPQYSPVSVEKQVAIIHLGTNNRMKDVPVNKIKEFEALYLSEVERQIPDVLENFRAKKFDKADLAKLDEVAAGLVPQFS